MLRQLKPVSDLQRTQGFDDYDLTDNRAGKLSSRQRWRFVGGQLAEHALGMLVALFAFALLVNMFHLAPSIEIIGLVAAVMVVVSALLFVYHVRAILKPGVQSVSGTVDKQDVMPLDSLPLEAIRIAQTAFYVRPDVYDVLDDDGTYKVYFLPRSQRLGGNLILSVEAVPHERL